MTTQTIKVLMIAQKNKPNADGKVPIFARITVGKESRVISTKLWIAPERWGNGKALGNLKEDKAINKILEELRFAIMQKHTEMLRSGEEVTFDKLKLALQGKDYDGSCRYFIELFDRWLEEYKKQIGISTSEITYGRYVVVRNRLQEYIKKTTKMDDILLNEVTPFFITGFNTYNRNEYPIANNYAMKQLQKLRTIYQVAIDNGWAKRNPFATIKIRYENNERGFLTKDELARIMAKKFTIPRMEHMRDVFVFSCFTGLSHCDVSKLKQENVYVDSDGRTWIKTYRNKTDVPVHIPLLEVPQIIIAKYRNMKQLRGKLLPVPSNQKCNTYLKELADVCDINKNITFHMARHTFATTVTLTNGVPIETVSKLLGHRSIRTTQIYAKVINEKLAEDMTDLATRIDGKFELASPKKAKPYLTMEEIEERTRRLHPDGNFKLKDAACYIS